MWASAVEKDALKVAEEEWRLGMQAKSSLDFYRSVKKEVKREGYLDCKAADNRAASLRVGLRGGTNALEVSRARLERKDLGQAPVAREERKCKVCSLGEAEDVPHFLLRCPAIASARRAMLRRLEPVVPPALSWGDWVNVLLGVPSKADGSPLEVSKEGDLLAMREVLKLSRARHKVLYPPAGPVEGSGSSSGDRD